MLCCMLCDSGAPSGDSNAEVTWCEPYVLFLLNSWHADKSWGRPSKLLRISLLGIWSANIDWGVSCWLG